MNEEGRGAVQIRRAGGVAQCLPREHALLLQGKRRQTGVIWPFVGGQRIGGGTGPNDGHVTADSELFAGCCKVPAKLCGAVSQQLTHLRQRQTPRPKQRRSWRDKCGRCSPCCCAHR